MCVLCVVHIVLKIPRFNCFVLLQTCDLCCGVALLLIHIAFIRTITDQQVSPVYYHSNQSMYCDVFTKCRLRQMWHRGAISVWIGWDWVGSPGGGNVWLNILGGILEESGNPVTSM